MRRVFKAAAVKGLPVVVLNDALEGAKPVEYADATEAYALKPLVVAGQQDRGASKLPVRVVVSRRYPRPYDVFVDPGEGEYAKVAEFPAAPSNDDLVAVIRAALASGG